MAQQGSCPCPGGCTSSCLGLHLHPMASSESLSLGLPQMTHFIVGTIGSHHSAFQTSSCMQALGEQSGESLTLCYLFVLQTWSHFKSDFHLLDIPINEPETAMSLRITLNLAHFRNTPQKVTSSLDTRSFGFTTLPIHSIGFIYSVVLLLPRIKQNPYNPYGCWFRCNEIESRHWLPASCSMHRYNLGQSSPAQEMFGECLLCAQSCARSWRHSLFGGWVFCGLYYRVQELDESSIK